MNSVTLTNIPWKERQDAAGDGLGRGPHVYPFWARSCAPLYQQLVLPSQHNQIYLGPSAVRGCQPSISKTWFNVTYSHFDKGGPLQRWPFGSTTVMDQDSKTVPTDRGALPPGDLGDEVEALFPDERPSASRSTASKTHNVNKPPLTDTRARKFKIVVPAPLRAVLREYNLCFIKTKNAAIQHVNQATKMNDDRLDVWALYKVFVTADSPLVHKDPSLAQCPTKIRRGAVEEAVEARKALITRFGGQGRIPDIGLLPLDPSRPFCFTLAAEAGWIVPQWRDANDPSQGQWNPKLELLTRTLKARKVDSKVHIHLRGQAARRWLLEHCKQKVVCEGRGKIKRQALRYELPREWRLQLDRFGDYFFILQYKVPQSEYIVRQKLEGHNLLVRSVDPGVRTALAVYSSDGTTLDFGSQKDRDRLAALRLERDQLQGEQNRRRPSSSNGQQPVNTMTTTEGISPRESKDNSNGDGPFFWPAKVRRRLRLRQRRLAKRHHQLVQDLHARAAHYLASTSDIIIMPRMEVRAMIRRQRPSRLRRTTKQQLVAWGHCAFLNRLLIKCHDVVADARFPHKTQSTLLLVQPESYTSKTCPQCGHLHPTLGSSKHFNCPQCPYRADRDHNGAVNMILRALRPTTPHSI